MLTLTVSLPDVVAVIVHFVHKPNKPGSTPFQNLMQGYRVHDLKMGFVAYRILALLGSEQVYKAGVTLLLPHSVGAYSPQP